MIEGTLSQYALAVISGTLPPILPYGALNNTSDNLDSDDECHNDEDGGPLPGSQAMAQVTLASTSGECLISDIASRLLLLTYISQNVAIQIC